MGRSENINDMESVIILAGGVVGFAFSWIILPATGPILWVGVAGATVVGAVGGHGLAKCNGLTNSAGAAVAEIKRVVPEIKQAVQNGSAAAAEIKQVMPEIKQAAQRGGAAAAEIKQAVPEIKQAVNEMKNKVVQAVDCLIGLGSMAAGFGLFAAKPYLVPPEQTLGLNSSTVIDGLAGVLAAGGVAKVVKSTYG